MAIRNIVKRGDETLTKKSRPVTNFDERLHILLDDMLETMRKTDGVGIAAPQVGVLRRAVIVAPPDQPHLELINGEILSMEGSAEGNEGCLSVPGIFGVVKRPTKITCRAQDRNGKTFTFTATGYAARIVCHELDHLEGILFTDKVERLLEPEELEGN